MMEMAKVTSKGQITIPISIRRRLGIDEGNKILFINRPDGVLMVNPDTVQGDISDYSADSVPAAAAAADTSPAEMAASKPAPAKSAEPASVKSEPPAPVAAKAPGPVEPPRRKYIPPVEEPEQRPAKAGGIDLSTLLDDIRSIGDI